MTSQIMRYFIELLQYSSKLEEADKDVLIKRLRGKTLKQMARTYKITLEGVRQREKRAIMRFIKKIYQPILFGKK